MSQLISCQTCRKNISDQASSCPHCGHKYYPEHKNWQESSNVFLGIILIGFVMIIIFIIIVNSVTGS